jgi:hypothetical protein
MWPAAMTTELKQHQQGAELPLDSLAADEVAAYCCQRLRVHPLPVQAARPRPFAEMAAIADVDPNPPNSGVEDGIAQVARPKVKLFPESTSYR